MNRVNNLLSVMLMLVSVSVLHAGQACPLQNGTFASQLTGWSVCPAPNPDINVEEEYVTWDEESKSALLLPYGADKGLPTTYTRLSQEFSIPDKHILLTFDVTMKTVRPGFETDVLSVTLNQNKTLYELSSSQVNVAALSNDSHVTTKYFDRKGLLQYALYKTTVNTNVTEFMESTVKLMFQLENDNLDNCISSVYIDNIQVLPDTVPPVPTVIVSGITELWPPNHKYHSFTLADCISAVDNADGQMAVNECGKIISLSSDEPEDVTGNGDGRTVNDMVIIDNHTFKVLAERQGAGNGRVYCITAEVRDTSGNCSMIRFYLGTPHDQSGAPPVDDSPLAGYTVINSN